LRRRGDRPRTALPWRTCSIPESAERRRGEITPQSARSSRAVSVRRSPSRPFSELPRTSAPVRGLGHVGAFIPVEVVPGTNNCTYGDVSIGPSGQVMQACTLTESGQGGGKIFVNVDPDGLGPAGFGDRTFVTQTHVGGFDFIPAQQGRSVDAEPGLAWDRTGGPHAGRAALAVAYTGRVKAVLRR